jgi:hypothetical protein
MHFHPPAPWRGLVCPRCLPAPWRGYPPANRCLVILSRVTDIRELFPCPGGQ